jgi:hypothetical protein
MAMKRLKPELFGPVGNSALDALVDEADERLRRVLESVS